MINSAQEKTSPRSLFARMTLVMSALFLLEGATYKSPDGDEPKAQVIFETPIDGGAAGYYLAADDSGDSPIGGTTRLATTGTFYSPKSTTISVAATKRFYIQARWNGNGTGVGYGCGNAYKYCNAVGSFVPEAGKTYKVTETVTPMTCSVVVEDQASTAPPDSLVNHDGIQCKN